MNEDKLTGYVIAIVSLSVMAYVALSGMPRLPIATANGVYASTCCGSFELKNGQMTASHQYMNYVIETDKIGSYILADKYVGVSLNNRVEFDRGSGPLLLRLDDKQNPQIIELPARGHRGYVAFNRVAPTTS